MEPRWSQDVEHVRGQESLIMRVAQVSAKPRKEQRPRGSLEKGEGQRDWQSPNAHAKTFGVAARKGEWRGRSWSWGAKTLCCGCDVPGCSTWFIFLFLLWLRSCLQELSGKMLSEEKACIIYYEIRDYGKGYGWGEWGCCLLTVLTKSSPGNTSALHGICFELYLGDFTN